MLGARCFHSSFDRRFILKKKLHVEKFQSAVSCLSKMKSIRSIPCSFKLKLPTILVALALAITLTHGFQTNSNINARVSSLRVSTRRHGAIGLAGGLGDQRRSCGAGYSYCGVGKSVGQHQHVSSLGMAVNDGASEPSRFANLVSFCQGT